MSVCEECLFDHLWTDETTTCPKECEGCQIIDGEPSKFKPKPKTNADRIRAMSDEELAILLWWFDKDKIARENEYSLTKRKIVEWLQQPSEGE